MGMRGHYNVLVDQTTLESGARVWVVAALPPSGRVVLYCIINFLGFVQLACVLILLRQAFRDGFI
jgi:hypothetical protein